MFVLNPAVQVRAAVNKLICTAGGKGAAGRGAGARSFSVLVDGVRVPHVRFVSVSPRLASTLVRTFPVASFTAPDPVRRRADSSLAGEPFL